MTQSIINQQSIITKIIDDTTTKAKSLSENNPLLEIMKNSNLSSKFHDRVNVHIYNYLLLNNLKKEETNGNFKAQEIYNKEKKA